MSHRSLLPLLIFLCVPPVLAQSPSVGEREFIRGQQQRRIEEQQKRLEELRHLPAPAAPKAGAPAGGAGQCVPVGRIEVEGALKMPAHKTRERAAPFEGQCLDSGKLDALLNNLTAWYLDRGWIAARAYLPAQDARGGTLTVKVVEGKLEAIEGGERGPGKWELKAAFPGKVGKMPNLRDLEQMVDQLSRLPSRQVKIGLLPGGQEGGSRVKVEREEQKGWRIGLKLGNDGEKSTGPWQIGANFALDSPLGLADQLALHATRDIKTWHRAESQGLGYSIPWGNWLLSYSAQSNQYQYLDDGAGLQMRGRSHSQQLKLDWLAHRNAKGKTHLGVGLAQASPRNWVEGIQVEAQSVRTTEVQLTLSHGRRVGNSFINAELGWQRGIGMLDAAGRGHPRGAEPDPRYSKATLTLSAFVPIASLWGGQISYDALAWGQKSEAPLHSAQRVGLGGTSSVRGFKDHPQYGASGGYWRNNLRWGRPANFLGIKNISAAIGYDMGVLLPKKEWGEGRVGLSGAAVELAASGKYASLSLAYGHSLDKPKGTKREHPVTLALSLTY